MICSAVHSGLQTRKGIVTAGISFDGPPVHADSLPATCHRASSQQRRLSAEGPGFTKTVIVPSAGGSTVSDVSTRTARPGVDRGATDWFRREAGSAGVGGRLHSRSCDRRRSRPVGAERQQPSVPILWRHVRPRARSTRHRRVRTRVRRRLRRAEVVGSRHKQRRRGRRRRRPFSCRAIGAASASNCPIAVGAAPALHWTTWR